MRPLFAIAPHLSHPYAGRWWILGAFVPYAVAVWLARRRGVPAWLVFAVAAVVMVPLMLGAAPGSQDVFSYLFYGKMLAAGHNPLVYAPNTMPPDSWSVFVQWPRAPSVYGPLWLYAMRAVVVAKNIHVALFLAKLLAVAGIVVSGALLARDRAWRALALLWNPLVVWSCAADGHVDGVLCGLVVGAATARRARPWLSTGLLTAATLIKPTFAILLALHVVELGARRTFAHAAAALAAIAAFTAPLWAGRATFNGLRQTGMNINSSLALLLKHAIGASAARVVVAALLAVVLARLVVTIRRREYAETLACGLAATLFFSPWFLPWHIVPLVGLVLVPGAPTATKRAVEAGTLAATGVVSFTSLAIRWPVVAAGAWMGRFRISRAGE